MRHIYATLAVLVTIGCAAAVRADGLIIVDRPVDVAPTHHRFAPLHVKHHHVKVTINDQVAVTEIDQIFHNPSDQRLEGTYIFPIPAGAQIDRFAMDINGKSVLAELLDADKARKIYEDIVRSMRDPALLEYSDRGAFKARIFPIEPNSDKRVSIQYTEVLNSDTNLVSYVYPLNTEKFSSRQVGSVSVKVDLRTSRPLKSIYSPSHSVEIIRHGTDRAVVGYEAANVRPDIDFQLFFSPQPPAGADVAIDLLTYHTGAQADGGYFMLLAAPGMLDDASASIPKDVVFILDTSGSMAGEKLRQAKRALKFCLENLNATGRTMDRFEIVRFSTEAEPLFGKLVDATPKNRAAATEFIDRLKPIGGTAIDESLSTALRTARNGLDVDRPLSVIFLTDGKPTIGSTDEDQIVANVSRLAGDDARVFCFGIGTEVNTHLLDKITEATHAYSQYVLPEEDIEVKVSNFYTKIAHPVLDDLALSVTGGIRLTKLHPHPLPDLFRGQQLVAFGRYHGHGDTAVVLEGRVSGSVRRFVQDARFAAESIEHGFIPRLWATRRVGYLLDQIRLHGESTELRDEIVDLARTHGIVTPYTSYLIVEDESVRAVPMANRTLQLMAGDAVARRQAQEHYYSLDSKSGGIAADNAIAGQELRRGGNLDAAGISNRTSVQRSAARLGELMPGSEWATAAAADGRYDGAHNVRVVNGRAFFQNGKLWVDSDSQAVADDRTVQLKFGGDEYFELARRNRDARAWMALGNNVQFSLEGVIYQVVE